MISPMMKKVDRHPTEEISTLHKGAITSPPKPMPVVVIPMARPRRRSNQLATTWETGTSMRPARQTAIATNMTYR